MCQPAAQLAAAKRLYDLLHEDAPYHNGAFERWRKEPDRDSPFHYWDGVTIWLSPVELAPDDQWLSPSVAEQAPGDEDEAADD